jgi:NAD+ diphosphatase
MLGYFCKYEEGNIQLNDAELEEARWFDLDDLPIIPPDTSISGQLIRSYILDRSKL